MQDVNMLKAAAAEFEGVLLPASLDPGSARAVDRLQVEPSMESIADLLAGGDPTATLDAINELAPLLTPMDGISPQKLPRLIYLAAIRVRMLRSDIGETVAALDHDLETSGPELFPDDEIFMQAVGASLLPLAGLDIQATFHFTRIYMENFPSFSLPLGDYDLRATRWLAQLMDIGGIRAAYRECFRDLAALVDDNAPRAATRLRAWVDGPPPADQTEDLPWMQGLLALARSQL